jgi:hypothetical protein
MLCGKAFIDQNPNASPAEIVAALDGLFCRRHARSHASGADELRPGGEIMSAAKISRRDLLKGAGALTITFNMSSGAKNLDAEIPSLDQVDSWLAIAQDGSVTAYSGKCDFGQGFATVQTSTRGRGAQRAARKRHSGRVRHRRRHP